MNVIKPTEKDQINAFFPFFFQKEITWKIFLSHNAQNFMHSHVPHYLFCFDSNFCFCFMFFFLKTFEIYKLIHKKGCSSNEEVSKITKNIFKKNATWNIVGLKYFVWYTIHILQTTVYSAAIKSHMWYFLKGLFMKTANSIFCIKIQTEKNQNDSLVQWNILSVATHNLCFSYFVFDSLDSSNDIIENNIDILTSSECGKRNINWKCIVFINAYLLFTFAAH